MRIIFLIIATVLLGHSLFSQNLVKNGSFEEFYRCPDNYLVDYQAKFLPGWSMPTKGTPDYFNKCSKDMVGIPQNFMGSIFPAHGNGFVGLVILDSPNLNETINYKDYLKRDINLPVTIKNKKKKKDKPKELKPINYREYIQSSFIIPLQKNNLYIVSFKYALANYSTFISNRLGVLLSREIVKQKDGVINYTPQLSIDSTMLCFEPGIWHEFQDTFMAYGGESFITIGNFYDDRHTSTILNDISDVNTTLQHTILTNQIAYVYIDDVKVELLRGKAPIIQRYIPFSQISREEIDVLKDSSYFAILDEVYFNVGNPDIEPLSLYQHKQLLEILKNSTLGINIYGALQEHELDNSEATKRLDNLKHWLIDSGIDNSRIKTKVLQFKSVTNNLSYTVYGIEYPVYSRLVMFNLFSL